MTKEEIKLEITRCREKLERLEKELAESNDKIDLVKEYEGKHSYWINPFGEVREQESESDISPDEYPSRLTAEKEALRIKLIQIAYILNGGDFVPKVDETSYYIYHKRGTTDIVVGKIFYDNFTYGFVLFKTRELAEKAMKQFSNEELIKMLS